jgi:anti-sigma regulatory factor (Ser/Thr protein kinase)
MTARLDERMEIELEAQPESVPRARQACRDVAESVGAPVADVALAASEAVGNSVVHAYRDRRPGKIRIICTLAAGRLLIEVSDDGRGMTPDVEGRGLGMGIALISRLAHEVRFNSSASGTTVSMSFALAGGG